MQRQDMTGADIANDCQSEWAGHAPIIEIP